jgi:hypothetical protein
MNWKVVALAAPLIATLVACPPAPEPPNFTLGIAPSSLTFVKPTSGNSAAQTVVATITPNSTFADSVILTVEAVGSASTTGINAPGLNGVPAVTIPAGSTVGNISITVSSAAATASGANYEVKAVGGSITQTQPLSLTVNPAVTPPPPPPPPAPNFTVAVSNVQAVTKPASGTSGNQNVATVTVTPSNGFTGNVSVAITGGPAGVTFNPLSINVTGASAVNGTLTATVTSTATAATTNGLVAAGTGTISGSSATRNSAPFSLTVNPAPPPALDNIAITSPTTFTAANGKLNLNVPTTFTAVARDASNTPLSPQPTITWSSSDSAKVSVTNAGVATANQLGTTPVTLTASATVGAITRTATVIVQAVYSFQGSIGMQTGVATGAAYIVKIQQPNGTKTGGSRQNVTVKGPAGYGTAGTATILGSEFSWDASNDFGVLRAPPGTAPTTLVNGSYTMETTVGSDTYTTAAQTVNTASTLPVPTGISFSPAPQPAGSQTTTVSWSAVAGASSYRVVVLKGATETFVTFADTATTSTSVTFTGLAGESFKFLVIAYSTNITSSSPTLPAQFNVSSAFSGNYVIP